MQTLLEATLLAVPVAIGAPREGCHLASLSTTRTEAQ